MTYEECLKITEDKWAQMDDREKMDALNAIEQHESLINARDSCLLDVKEMYAGSDGVVLGQYNHQQGTIYLNAETISKNTEYSASSSTVIESLLHEGRHSYQHQAVEGRINHPNDAEVAAWRENFEKYIHFQEDPQGYFEQPVEADARSYAEMRYQAMIAEQKALAQAESSQKTVSQILATPSEASAYSEAKASFISQMSSEGEAHGQGASLAQAEGEGSGMAMGG